jgi:uncharacterized protein Smg (DUF494 family)
MYSLNAILIQMGVLSSQFEFPLEDIGFSEEEIDNLRYLIALAILSKAKATVVDDYVEPQLGQRRNGHI